MLPRSLTRTAAFSIFIISLSYAVYIHLVAPIFPYDDAFITFRYVEQYFQHGELVYNHGERIFGVSSPLIIGWLVMLRSLFHELALPTLAVRGNWLFFIATGVGFYLLLAETTAKRSLPAVAAATLMVNQRLLAISLGGMESFLFCALMMFALLAAVRDRSVPFGLLAGLALLTRPEGAFLVVAGLVAFGRRPRQLAMAALSAGVPIASWLIFAHAYYGTVIPHSVIAKSRPLFLLPPGSTGILLLQKTGSFLTGYGTGSNRFSTAFGLLILALLVVGLGASWLVKSRLKIVISGAASVYLGTVIMYAVGNVYYFDWYTPGLQLSFWVSTLCILSLFSTNFIESRWNFVARSPKAFDTLVALSLAVGTLPPAHAFGDKFTSVDRGLGGSGWRTRVEPYRQAAGWINARRQVGDAVAAPEIGALGFYLDGKVFDSCGLVSPEALPFLPIRPSVTGFSGDNALDPRFVQATRAQWVAATDIFLTRLSEPDEWFRTNFELVHSIPLLKPEFGAVQVRIYRRKLAGPTSL